MGQVAWVRDNQLGRTTQSEYDLAGRPCRVKTYTASEHVYTGEVAYDDAVGLLAEFDEKVGESRSEYQTTFAYDEENRPTALTYKQGSTTMGGSGRTIDLLGRTTFATVTVGGQTYTSKYHFAQGGYGTNSRTGMVTSIAQAGKNWSYSYDDNGNIIQGYDRGKWFAYTYDALGQLIQVNDRSDPCAGSDGSTWVFSYDQGGNILSKKLYPYANTSGTPIEEKVFTYGDTNWRDKVTAINGVPITYDAIGNPLNDGTWTYTWQNGRQLQSMTNGTTTAGFVYNKDGLRVQKTVNGVVTRYTLNGKNVAHMTRGSDELHFFYDAQNRPAVVIYNGTAYAYAKNLQGDIVGILDNAGNWVVEYTYDAWGAPTTRAGSMADTLGVINPFRYRGYVYDEETGLYYLRSRYYTAWHSRFLNSDGYLFDKNQYSYCKNCPVSQTDADGKASHTYLGDGSDDPINTLIADDMTVGCGGGTWGAFIRTLQCAADGLNMAAGQRDWSSVEAHHMLSNKNLRYTPQFEGIVEPYGMSLTDDINIVALPGHRGRHTNAYHDFMLSSITELSSIAKGEVDIFLEGFEVLREFLINNNWLPYAR